MKKKIGIVTLVHVHNIGAVLQAYSTKIQLEILGYEVINLMPYGIKEALTFFKGDIGSLRPYTWRFNFERCIKFEESFRLFDEKKLEKADLREYSSIILGSDSIWMPKYGKQEMPAEFFGNIRFSNIYSYAASSGGIIDSALYSEKQKNALKKIKKITVRDEHTKKLIKNLIGSDADIVLDPTLLVDWNTEISKLTLFRPKEIGHPYLLVYGGMSEKMIVGIKKLALKKHLRIINLAPYCKAFEYNIAVSPIEFLFFIQNAELVITSMFHGVMLSMGFRKNFIYFSSDSNRSKKLSTTMNSLGFNNDDWIWDDQTELSIDGTNYPVDFENRLNTTRGYSLDRLKTFLYWR